MKRMKLLEIPHSPATSTRESGQTLGRTVQLTGPEGGEGKMTSSVGQASFLTGELWHRQTGKPGPDPAKTPRRCQNASSFLLPASCFLRQSNPVLSFLMLCSSSSPTSCLLLALGFFAFRSTENSHTHTHVRSSSSSSPSSVLPASSAV